MRPLITLTTDFGLDDPFVGIMKGVILNIEPEVHIIDITHNIEPQDIFQASQVLKATYPWYPRKTIHIVVVDPGVGGHVLNKSPKTSNLSLITEGRGPLGKRPIVVQSEFQTFIGPDNGVLTSALSPKSRTYELNNPKYFLKNISNTFHGRDLFASAAAWIATGITASKMGSRILKPIRLELPEAILNNNCIKGEIIYIDRFGNATTNISAELMSETFTSSDTIEFKIGKNKIDRLVTGYFQVNPGQTGAIVNSWDQLEIFCRDSSAEKNLKLQTGQSVTLKLK
jgi:S-adenosyl-L-methionine hydrolase (adenosine-forming)